MPASASVTVAHEHCSILQTRPAVNESNKIKGTKGESKRGRSLFFFFTMKQRNKYLSDKRKIFSITRSPIITRTIGMKEIISIPIFFLWIFNVREE